MIGAITAMLIVTAMFGYVSGLAMAGIWANDWKKPVEISINSTLFIVAFVFNAVVLAQVWAINGSSYDGIYYAGFVIFIPMSLLVYRIYQLTLKDSR